MQKQILTTLDTDDIKSIVIEAIKEANEQTRLPNESPEDEVYFDQKQAANFLRISLPTIIKWKKQGKLPYYQEGRKVLFKKSELLKVLRKNENLLK